eukprot:gene8591-10570_t
MSKRQHQEYLLEKVGDKVQIVQLFGDGFENLTKQEKIFAYFLSCAAVAGRDINYDQKNSLNLETRQFLEELYTFFSNNNTGGSAKYSKVVQAIDYYLKLLWVGNGPFDSYTNAKILLGCTAEELIEVAKYVHQNSKIPIITYTMDNIQEKVVRLSPLIFDPNWRKMLTEKSPSVDWIKESAVNFFSNNLTLEEVQKFVDDKSLDKYPLNSTIVKDPTTGQISLDVWRAGCSDLGIIPGRYAKELNKVISYLEKSIPYASSDSQKDVVRQLIKFFKTGEEEDFREFNIKWVSDHSRIDFILGFIEVYLDPMGLRGEYEGSIYFQDEKLTSIIQKIGDNAQYFEDRMPWETKFKKTDVKPLSASVVNVITSVGGSGPISPVGVNLPNEESLREKYGSKSIVLQNVTESLEKSGREEKILEFCYDDQERELQKLWGSYSDNIETALHEVLGHASGKTMVEDPQKCLPGYYSTLEEARADLVALWHIYDPKLIQLGVIPSLDVAKQMYLYEVRNALLVQLHRVGEGDQLEEDHMKNRQLIANYILKNSNAIECRKRDGKTFYSVTNFEEARKQVGILLSEIMRIKAEGDLPAAKKLVDEYGLYIDTKLRDEVVERIKKLNLPLYSALVMPTLVPKFSESNPTEIDDIKIEYNQTFNQQMLGFSTKF